MSKQIQSTNHGKQGNSYKNVAVLVTGGAGFIGSHVVKALVAEGARVTILDDLSTGSLDNLKGVLDDVILIKQSITDINACLHAAYKQKVIYHCAAITDPRVCQEQPDVCYSVNVTGTHNILQAARFNSIDRLVYSSSAAVYGESDKPCSEESQCNPLSSYGYSKLMGEYLCKQYAKIYNISTAILRYFNVYSEDYYKQSSRLLNVVDRFKYNMDNNYPVVIYGDGTQTRDFVHINKVVRANVLAGIAQLNTPLEIFNIASGQSITILNLFNRLKQEFSHYTQDIEFKPAKSGEIKHSYANCQKFKLFEDSTEKAYGFLNLYQKEKHNMEKKA